MKIAKIIYRAKLTFPATPENWQTVVDIGVKNGLKWSEEAWSGIIGVCPFHAHLCHF